jgi:hypothetical protein
MPSQGICVEKAAQFHRRAAYRRRASRASASDGWPQGGVGVSEPVTKRNTSLRKNSGGT